jgi:hypothetical protein
VPDPLPQLAIAQSTRLTWAQTRKRLKSGDLDLPHAASLGFPSTVRAMEALGLAVVGGGISARGGHAGRVALRLSRQGNLTHFTYAAALSVPRWAQLQSLVDQAVSADSSARLRAAS